MISFQYFLTTLWKKHYYSLSFMNKWTGMERVTHQSMITQLYGVAEIQSQGLPLKPMSIQLRTIIYASDIINNS